MEEKEQKINTRPLCIIVAMSSKGGIGRQGKLLCHLPNDLKRFKKLTMGHPIIMGRKTFESLPNGPLPGRQNIVMTRNTQWEHPDGVTVAHSLPEAVAAAEGDNEIFIIGGEQVYKEALPYASKAYLTIFVQLWRGEDAFFDYDTFSRMNWILDDVRYFEPDDKHPFQYSFADYHLVGKPKPLILP